MTRLAEINEDYEYFIKLDTYDNYLENAKKYMDDDNDKWICDIIDKKTQRKPLYENDDFILIEDMTMKNEDPINTLHLLAFSKDKSIKTIRDVTRDNISSLQNMISDGKKYITDNYKINENEIETNIHYPPSVNLFHLHFNLINNDRKIRVPLREHPVHSVISNLTMDPDYYKKRTFEIIAKKEKSDTQ